MFTWQLFKLMFLSWNWEKVYSKMIVKSIFRCWKTINLPKNCYWEKTTLQRMISRHSPHSSWRWQQQQHSPLFLTIGPGRMICMGPYGPKTTTGVVKELSCIALVKIQLLCICCLRLHVHPWIHPWIKLIVFFLWFPFWFCWDHFTNKNNYSPQAQLILLNYPLDFVLGIIQQHQLRLRRIIVKYTQLSQWNKA